MDKLFDIVIAILLISCIAASVIVFRQVIEFRTNITQSK